MFLPIDFIPSIAKQLVKPLDKILKYKQSQQMKTLFKGSRNEYCFFTASDLNMIYKLLTRYLKGSLR